jgi:quinohemoprotein ethanol dehydrogenase
MSVKAVDNPSLQINPAEAEGGHVMFNMICAPCHGLNLRSTGSPGPDLRESGVALTEDGMWKVVHDGPLIQHGMPQYGTFTREQVHLIYMYIRAGAREALGKVNASPTPR